MTISNIIKCTDNFLIEFSKFLIKIITIFAVIIAYMLFYIVVVEHSSNPEPAIRYAFFLKIPIVFIYCLLYVEFCKLFKRIIKRFEK